MTTVNLCNSTWKGYCYSTNIDKKIGDPWGEAPGAKTPRPGWTQACPPAKSHATCPCRPRTDWGSHDHFLINQTVTPSCAWGTDLCSNSVEIREKKFTVSVSLAAMPFRSPSCWIDWEISVSMAKLTWVLFSAPGYPGARGPWKQHPQNP